jgi:hypothetical protein
MRGKLANVRFSGRAYPELARIVRALCAVAAACRCSLLLLSTAIRRAGGQARPGCTRGVIARSLPGPGVMRCTARSAAASVTQVPVTRRRGPGPRTRHSAFPGRYALVRVRARENMCGRFNLALGAEAAGFGEGHSLRGTSLRRARRLITWIRLSEQGRWCAGPVRSRRR